MIKPQDLRIGNYLEEGIVTEIGEDYFRIKNDGCTFQAYNVNPITLTYEWLQKFGFESLPVSWSKDISYFSQSYKTICVTLSQGIMIREGDRTQERSKDDVCVLWNKDVRGPIMVHNLQNIYYALTGEELTIKDKEIEPPMMGMSY